MNIQEEIGNPLAPLRRGPNGLAFDTHGIMLNVALVSTKDLSLVNSSVRKINPAFAGKCVAVAVALAVACAGVATEPARDRQHFNFLTRHKG
jgi:stringent starvation protein B